ncbi:MAG: amidohydrolase family protein [Candidatus Heimdallarchaeota archaeon]|nr:amidohydrolase family protein [Candidatus Heimdallarchaeota archaeon]
MKNENNDLILLPQGIDLHVHFREPGMEHKENISTGMNAANAGGISDVFDMPNNIPVTDTLENINYKLKIGKNYQGYHVIGGFTNQAVETQELKKVAKHVKLLKVFLADSTGNLSIHERNLLKGFKLLEGLTSIIFVHAESSQFISNRYDNSKELEVRPKIAEIEGIKQVIEFANDYPNQLFHITHVSTGEGAKLLSKQKLISWDILPKYLDFTTDLVNNKGNLAKMNPPLREESDVKILNSLLEEGKIPIITSDHAPHTLTDKEQIVAGAPGVQELYPVLLDRFLNQKISRKILENVTFYNPQLLLSKVGIEINKKQMLIDPNDITEINKNWIKSKCGWSLWEGKVLKGKILANSDIIS